MTSFVHLHVRSEFSLKDSIVRIKPLIAGIAAQSMPAVALTDLMNLYALVKFYLSAQGSGIKPIIGSTLIVREGDQRYEVLALVMNEAGYKNLMELVSRAYIEGQELGESTLQREWLEEAGDGLILLLGRRSDIGAALLGADADLAQPLLQRWMQKFPQRIYLELTRTQRDGEEDFIHAAIALAERAQCAVVATNDVRFLEEKDFDAHEVRVCVAQSHVLQDPKRPRDYSAEQYLKTPAQMAELFADIPEALENSVEIAKRCSFKLSTGKSFLPDYPTPNGMTLPDYFVQYSRECLALRLEKNLNKSAPDYAEKVKIYEARLEFELEIINKMGFAGYFLIVMDFIRWAKNNGVPVGPGRGSGAGSLVAYAMNITDIDPLPYDLLFERFLNPERVSMPDFDIDFCMDGRDRVIDYVANQYGRQAVSQIITFGTMAAKAVVRDVARVQGKSYGLADRISKLIPFTPGISLIEARAEEPQLEKLLSNTEETDHEDAVELWEMALRLEGITRGVGKHAGGVLIAPGKLTDYTPVFCDEEGRWVSQYDKDDVEKVGLVKFDFLGLRTLTIIDWALKDINATRALNGEAAIDIMALPMYDEASYKLLREARTTAVFQVESRGMKDLLKKIKPSGFEDLVALVALFRPGPLDSGMVQDFIDRKHGVKPVAYPDVQYQHECLEPILKPTYGVIVYQEQVMQIAQEMAGYSLGNADMLRRAMGKKDAAKMAEQRTEFMEGADKKGIDATLAGHIFDLMEKFAGYGFNKSHSAAYALVSYQTAWLKAHYPAEFMAAVLSAEMSNTDKIVTLIEECRSMKLVIELPDINHSQFKFVARNSRTIVYGLGAIKGVGEGPVSSIMQSRHADGEFKDLFDFCRRINLRKCNKRTLEGLVRAGALDDLGPHRGMIMASLDEAVAAAEQQARNQEAGMVDLFGDVVDSAPTGEFIDALPWTDDERLTAEKETLGLYLTGHPIDQYESELKYFVEQRLSDLQPTRRGTTTTVAGLVMASRTQNGARGTRAFVLLDDKTGRVEATLFGDTLEKFRHVLVKDTVVVVEGEVSHDDFSGGFKLVVRNVMSLADARATRSRGLQLQLQGGTLGPRFSTELQQLLSAHKPNEGVQGCLIRVKYHGGEGSADLRLGPAWRVQASDELLKRLRQQYGSGAVTVLY